MVRSLRSLFFLFAFGLLTSGWVSAQSYWNEWINFSQKYYKISVTQNGIYRLDSAALAGAGIPVTSLNPKNIQIFWRGVEQPLYIKGESDNQFNIGDYIEFYGKKNDGTLDSTLYKGDLYNNPVAKQPNPYYSLFSDTSAYFLTWNSSVSNKRFTNITDTTYSSLPQTDHFIKEELVEYHNAYYFGRSSSANINFPEYHEAEGWAGPVFVHTQSHTTTFNTTFLYPWGPNTELTLAAFGASNDQTVPDHRLQIKYNDVSNNLVTIKDTSFDGYTLVRVQQSIPSATLGGNTSVTVSALTGPWAVSRNAVAWMKLKYPHTLTLESKSYYELWVPDNGSQPKSNFTFTNFNDLGGAVFLYDLTTQTRHVVTKSGSNYRSLVPNALSSVSKFCVVKSENQFLVPAAIMPVRGTGTFTDYSQLGVDSAFLIITHKSLRGNPGADAYAAYRSSPAGGSHNVLIADIDELYDQFGYGIPQHPFAIRHFAEFCADTFPTMPHNLFLIGKSVQTNLVRNTVYDPAGNNNKSQLVPSICYPVSDNMLVAALNGNVLRPLIPIGRLAAANKNDIMTYLNKVNEFEHPQPDPDEWMKHIIHLSGGKTQAETDAFAAFLKGYETTLEDTSFGGFVHAFRKNSSSPTQISFADSIKGLINNGVSLVTFFGHSSANVFEFNILPPDQYSNTNGKYPFMCADGCVAGDIHQPPVNGVSSSEVYVLHDRGMIGFLATSGPGTPYELDQFSSNFFKHLGQNSYGRSVGVCIQEAIDAIDGNGSNPYMNAACLEMTLHGDPSIVIHAKPLPDYAVNNTSVYFEPSYVSTDLSTFNTRVIVTNIGKATSDSVRVTLRRTFADGTSQLYYDTLPRNYYKDTLTFTLPVDPLKGPGLNRFEVWVDSLNSVSEIEDVLNNNITSPFDVPLMIYSGDIIPVHPYRYAIVPDDTITLKAHTANPFASSARYAFEIDTTDLFNSPAKRSQLITQQGAVVKAPFQAWSPLPLILSDSVVYFWRVRRDTSDTVNFRWRESSFQYIPNKRGWGQSHFFQFLKGDQFKYVDTNRLTRYFDLEKTYRSLNVNTYNEQQISAGNTYFQMDGLNYYLGSWIPTENHVVVVVLDPLTGDPMPNPGGGAYGSVSVAPSNQTPIGDDGFEFRLNTLTEQNNLASFLKDTVPVGYKIALYTMSNHTLGDLLGTGPSSNAALKQAFQSFGATQFSTLQNDFPYIVIGTRGGTAFENVGDSLKHVIFLNDTFGVRRPSGYIYSETIGPASKWNSLHWRYVSPEKGVNDSMAAADTMKVTLLGLKANGTTDTLLADLQDDSLDVFGLDSLISAANYPYLRLQSYLQDKALKTPPQLRYWRIYYEGVPDASLNPVRAFSFYNTPIQQGDTVRMTVAIENISEYPMDSIWVDFWVYDANRNKVPVKSVKMDSLEVDSLVIPDVKFSTLDLPAGVNSLWVEANPFNSDHQLEQYHFNNIGTIPFTIQADHINPILDVTFDGVHIMDGDIVAAKPSVMIRLKDENTFLALNDTADFEVSLKYPGQSNFTRIYFGDKMTFESAQLPNNSCKISYTPVLPDGIYQLRVQAKDRTGNASGQASYQISFEVINKPTVTHVLNYPNPFSTSTRFVFTLTGYKVPDYFRIQIITVTGKVVREIGREELGPIHIGRNITEYAWDGKDQYGDQLANGLYLYRVITQLDGKQLEHRETSADVFFTEGYGKMYLIR